MSCGELITFIKRFSRANMQPIKNSAWFAKMKRSNKKLIITDNDFDKQRDLNSINIPLVFLYYLAFF